MSFVRQSKNDLGIERLTFGNKNQHDIEANHLILTAIDTRKEKLNIKLKKEAGIHHYIGKASSRNKAHLIFKQPLSEDQQLKLKNDFNDFMQTQRDAYSDLFLTNFRDHNRKRISFNFAYKLLNYLYLENQQTKVNSR